jgi:hypothetical protein
MRSRYSYWSESKGALGDEATGRGERFGFNNVHDMHFMQFGRVNAGRPLRAAKPLKKLKMAMGSYWFGAISA